MKEDTLLQCLLEAAQAPRPVVVVFLDEMGYTRWPGRIATDRRLHCVSQISRSTFNDTDIT
jgi:hypothetical protein